MNDLDEMLKKAERPSVHISDIKVGLVTEPLKCGFTDIEHYKYIRKEQPDLIIVAARPGTGKSSLALQLAKNVAEMSGPVLFFSLEMSKEQLKQKIYALESEVSLNRLSVISSEQKASIDAKLSKIPLHIDDEANLNVNLLMARSMDFNRHSKLSLVVVDYLQIVATSTGRSKAEEVAEVTQKLKSLAKTLNAPILALAQMNRQFDARAAFEKAARPMMSDIADSSAVEKWADMVYFLSRPYTINRSRPGEVDFFVGKNRHGEQVDFGLTFSGELTKFFNKQETSL